MEVIPTPIKGPLVVVPKVFKDSRGWFFESYSARDFHALVPGVTFVQDNISMSTRGVIRGLHFQAPPHAQAKLIRCLQGKILDVAVDIRRNSPTFGQHVAVELSDENCLGFFIPHGFAHGFVALSEKAVIQYKCDNYYAPQAEGGISIMDDSLGIDWRTDMDKAVISDKDTAHPRLDELTSPFYI